MDIKDLRKSIKECPCKDWFQSIEVKIQHTATNFEITIKGMENIYSFFQKESIFWMEISKENIDNFFINSKKQHDLVISQLDLFFNQNIGETEQILKQRWVNIQNIIQQDNINRFYKDNSCTPFLISLFKEQNKYFLGAYHFFVGNDINRMSYNKENFIGYDIAKNFFIADFIKLSTKGELEKLNIKKLKNKLSESIGNSTNDIIKYQSSMDEKVQNFSNTIDTLQKDHELTFTEWYGKSTEMFDTFNEESKQKIKDLEKAYKDLLTLKEPSKYWNERAIKLKKDGKNALHGLIAIVCMSVFLIFMILVFLPEGILLSFLDNKEIAVKWSIAFVTFISFLAYAIKTLNKVVFSSYHLARDAEEREQLVKVYLSLAKEGNIESKDKNLILQSLFSRAETGLLKDDSSPTMPNDVFSKFLGK